MNILLAEDDADDRNFFYEALEKLPISTSLTVAHDGEQLMLHLSNEANTLPDVLFLDINMPRKDGLECLSEIKRDSRLKNIPVIIFSTSMSNDTVSQVFKSGATVYIHKPGEFTQLMQVIHHGLQIASGNVCSNEPLKYILNA